MSAEQRNEKRAEADDARDEFAWRAFCYLHGELTADEAEAFEEDLAVHQSAREALAAAARLTEALQSAEVASETPEPSSLPCQRAGSVERPRASWWHRVTRRRVLVGAAAAACVALIVTFALNRPDRNGTGGDPQNHAGGNGESGSAQAALAEAWLDVGGADWSTHPLAAASDPSSAESDLHGAAGDLEEQGGPDAELTVPSWLLAALDSGADPLDETPEVNQ
jgi:hypothetical protein